MKPLRVLALVAIAATTATATSVASANDDSGQGLGTAEMRVGFDRIENATLATMDGGNGRADAGLGRYTTNASRR